MKKINLLVMGLVIASMTVPLASFCHAAPLTYVDLKVNYINYTLWPANVREVTYNIKNVGTQQANAPFYCNVYFDVAVTYNNISAMTRTLIANQTFLAILQPGAVSPDHYKFYTWANPDSDHYKARFTVWADSSNKFNNESSESDNWGSTEWFI